MATKVVLPPTTTLGSEPQKILTVLKQISSVLEEMLKQTKACLRLGVSRAQLPVTG